MIESDVKKYGERYWMMGLRVTKDQQQFSNRPSQKVIADIPDAFKSYSPGKGSQELEIIRKPISSKLKSKWEVKLPFKCYNSGKYFEDRLKQESPQNLAKIKHLDDRNYELLEVKGSSKLKEEISCLLDKSTDDTKYQMVKVASEFEGMETQHDEENLEPLINYDI